MIDNKVFNKVAQLSHFAWGALAPLWSLLLFKSVWWGVGLVMLWAAYREGYYDNKFETADERGSDLEDFLFYLLGVIVSVGLYFITR